MCSVRSLEQREADVAEAADPAWLAGARAWAVVDLGICARAGGPVADAGRPRGASIKATEAIARACATAGIPLIVVSCRHAGTGTGLCGATSASRERIATEIAPGALVIRPGALFGPWETGDPLTRRLCGLRSPRAMDEQLVSPAYIPDVVNAALDLVVDAESGLWELDHGVQATWNELSVALRALAEGSDPSSLVELGRHAHDHPLPLPALVDAMTRFMRETEPIWRRAVDGEPAEVVELDSAPGYEYPAMEPASTLTRASEAG